MPAEVNRDRSQMPPGRWRKATRDTWVAWWLTDAAAVWDAADAEAARRLIVLVNDLDRTKDPRERRRLAGTIRTASRDLGLHRRKAKPATQPRPAPERALPQPRRDPKAESRGGAIDVYAAFSECDPSWLRTPKSSQRRQENTT
jgi:hypothetical protein